VNFEHSGLELFNLSDSLRERNKNGAFRLELYNSKNDISETMNVATEHPEIVGRIEKIIQEPHTPLPKQQ